MWSYSSIRQSIIYGVGSLIVTSKLNLNLDTMKNNVYDLKFSSIIIAQSHSKYEILT